MNLFFRTDASVAIGTGHAMRCLALAQAWSDAGGRSKFAMAEATPSIEQRLQGENIEIVLLKVDPGSTGDAEETIALAQKHEAGWVVVDGYVFGADYQSTLKRAGLKVLFIDDNGHASHYSADLVLNQNAHATEKLYRSRDAATRLLLGAQFAMLRREFKPWRAWKREIRAVARRVLVSMGGSDPENFTLKAVDGLRRISAEGLQLRILAGGSSPHAASLQQLHMDGQHSIEIVKDATDMPKQMKWADLAVAAAGSTCLEMCLMGLPALLIDLAENQTPIANELAQLGIAYHLGNFKTVTPDQIATEARRLLASAAERTVMSENGRRLVDGAGAGRVVQELLVS